MKGSGGFYFGNPQEIAAKRKAGTVFLPIFLIFAISEKMLICKKKKKISQNLNTWNCFT